MKYVKYLALAIVSAVVFTACSAEQQNTFRRDVLNLANAKHYIILYGVNGSELFRGELNGKVTRAEKGDGGNGGEYVYWFDTAGKYWQTNLPYLVTTDDRRNGVLSSPPIKR